MDESSTSTESGRKLDTEAFIRLIEATIRWMWDGRAPEELRPAMRRFFATSSPPYHRKPEIGAYLDAAVAAFQEAEPATEEPAAEENAGDEPSLEALTVMESALGLVRRLKGVRRERARAMVEAAAAAIAELQAQDDLDNVQREAAPPRGSPPDAEKGGPPDERPAALEEDVQMKLALFAWCVHAARWPFTPSRWRAGMCRIVTTVLAGELHPRGRVDHARTIKVACSCGRVFGEAMDVGAQAAIHGLEASIRRGAS
jgi:hypothetical protein